MPQLEFQNCHASFHQFTLVNLPSDPIGKQQFIDRRKFALTMTPQQ
jgi:hypothetical protein